MRLDRAIATLKKHGKNYRVLYAKRNAASELTTLYAADLNGNTVAVLRNAEEGVCACPPLSIGNDGKVGLGWSCLRRAVSWCATRPGQPFTGTSADLKGV